MRGGIAVLTATLAVTAAIVAGGAAADASAGNGESWAGIGPVEDGPTGDRPVAVAGATGSARLPNGTTTDDGDATNGSAVRLVVRYPTGDGYRNETLVTGAAFDGVDEVVEGRETAYLPVTLNESGAERFSRRLRGSGITTRGISNCRWEVREGHCILTVFRGEVLYAAGTSPGLARKVNEYRFVTRPRFRLIFDDRFEARRVRAALLGRAPPTATTATVGAGGGPTGILPFENVPAPVILTGSGVIVVVSALVLFGRQPDDGDEEATRTRDGWEDANDDSDRRR